MIDVNLDPGKPDVTGEEGDMKPIKSTIPCTHDAGNATERQRTDGH